MKNEENARRNNGIMVAYGSGNWQQQSSVIAMSGKSTAAGRRTGMMAVYCDRCSMLII